MRKGALLAMLVVVVAGAVALVVVAAGSQRDDVLRLADDPVQALVSIQRGERFCQDPVRLPDAVDSATLIAAPGAKERGPIRLTAIASGSGRTLATATLDRRILTGRFTRFEFDRPVAGDQTIALCVANGGRGAIQIWGDRPGNGRSTLTTSSGFVDGDDTGGDIALTLYDGRSRSLLERIPAALSAAAAYKLGGVGAWLTWLLAALALVGVPLLLGRALARAADADGPGK